VIWVLQTAQLPLDGQQRKVTSPLQRSGGFEFLWRSSKVKERKKKGVCVLLSDTAEDESFGSCSLDVCVYVCVPCPSLSASCTGRKRKKSYDALRPLLPAAPPAPPSRKSTSSSSQERSEAFNRAVENTQNRDPTQFCDFVAVDLMTLVKTDRKLCPTRSSFILFFKKRDAPGNLRFEKEKGKKEKMK
jgi:hypothetical protein